MCQGKKKKEQVIFRITVLVYFSRYLAGFIRQKDRRSILVDSQPRSAVASYISHQPRDPLAARHTEY